MSHNFFERDDLVATLVDGGREHGWYVQITSGIRWVQMPETDFHALIRAYYAYFGLEPQEDPPRSPDAGLDERGEA